MRQRDERDRAIERGRQLARNCEGEPRLTDTAGTNQGDQTGSSV